MIRAALITASLFFLAACEGGPSGGSAENQTREFEDSFRNRGS